MIPLPDQAGDDEVARAEAMERAAPPGSRSTNLGLKSAAGTSGKDIRSRRRADGSSSLMPVLVPGAPNDTTITSGEVVSETEVIEYRHPAVSRAGVFKRVFVGPLARGWRWRSVVTMPSGVEAVIGDFND